MKRILAFTILFVTMSHSAVAASLERGSFSFDGRDLSFFCAGSGEPTLVLEAPSGISNEEAFANVLDDLSGEHLVCAYERAYYGSSEPLADGQIQSLDDYAAELAAFINAQHLREPVVLIGYSYGGWVSRFYAAHHPERVQGLVLIDTPHIEWMRQMKARMSDEDWLLVEDIFAWFLENRGHDAWRSQFEMEAAPELPRHLPVAVITRTQNHERMRLSGVSEAGFRIYNDLHYELAPELLDLTENTVGFQATRSQHFVPDTEPEVVLQALRAVLEKSKRYQADLR